jgi:hypothetical protein
MNADAKLDKAPGRQAEKECQGPDLAMQMVLHAIQDF